MIYDDFGWLRTVEDTKFWKELPKVRLRLVSGGFRQLRRASNLFDAPEIERIRPYRPDLGCKPVVNCHSGRFRSFSAGPKE